MSENFFEKLSAEGSQFTKDDTGLLLLHYLFSDKEKVRKTAQILFMEQAPELKKDIEEIWKPEYRLGGGLSESGRKNLAKIIEPFMNLDSCVDSLLSFLVQWDIDEHDEGFRLGTANHLIAQVLNNIGNQTPESASKCVDKFAKNLDSLMKLDERGRKILMPHFDRYDSRGVYVVGRSHSHPFGDDELIGKLMLNYELIIFCDHRKHGIYTYNFMMKKFGGRTYCFYGERDFSRPTDSPKNDYIHEGGFDIDHTYCEMCLDHDMSGGSFNKIARLSKPKPKSNRRKSPVPKTWHLSQIMPMKHFPKEGYPKATISKSSDKCFFTGEKIDKGEICIDGYFEKVEGPPPKDISELPVHSVLLKNFKEHFVKSSFPEWIDSVEALGNETDWNSPPSVEHKNNLYGIYSSIVMIGEPATISEIAKVSGLSLDLVGQMIRKYEWLLSHKTDSGEIVTGRTFESHNDTIAYFGPKFFLASWFFQIQLVMHFSNNFPKDKLKELDEALNYRPSKKS